MISATSRVLIIRRVSSRIPLSSSPTIKLIIRSEAASWVPVVARDGPLWSGTVRAVVLLLAGVLAAACTTACTTTVEGTPSAPTGVLLPPRPREVRLDGVDPCSLLTAEQRAGLDLDGEPRYSRSYAELFRGDVPTCTITGYSAKPVVVGVGMVTTAGVERWQLGELAAEVRTIIVADFPAVVARPTRFTNFCSVEVDVAPGQLLDVQISDGGGRPPLPQRELCSRAEETAVELVRSLLAR